MIAFRELILDALNDVMRMRVPYMMNSLDLIVKNATDEMQKIVIDCYCRPSHILPKFKNVSEMCAACGIKAAQIDLALVNAIQKQSLSCGFSDAEEHYNISCLLFVFIAVALPKLASSRQSFFRASLIGE
jgi:NCK-associated protein 1